MVSKKNKRKIGKINNETKKILQRKIHNKVKKVEGGGGEKNSEQNRTDKVQN